MKNTFLLLCVYCLCTTGLVAQKTPFQFGLAFYPNYNNSWTSKISRDLVGTDIGSVGYSIGLFAEKQLRPHWSIRAGVNYGTAGYRRPKNPLTWPSEFVNGSYVPDPALAKHLAWGSTFGLLEIPVRVHYQIKPGKKFYLSAGLAPLVSLNSNTTTTLFYQDGRKEVSKTNLEFDEPGLGLHIGAGFLVPLTSKWTLEIQPELRRTKISLDSNGPRLYQAGVQFGVKI